MSTRGGKGSCSDLRHAQTQLPFSGALGSNLVLVFTRTGDILSKELKRHLFRELDELLKRKSGVLGDLANFPANDSFNSYYRFSFKINKKRPRAELISARGQSHQDYYHETTKRYRTPLSSLCFDSSTVR